MKDLESNKIFAAILLAGVIAMFSGFVAQILSHPHDLEKDAVEIEGTAQGGGHAAQAEKLPEPILALIETADSERGKKISKACAACHSFTKGGAHGVGPNIWNTIGHTKESKEGYSYSGTLRSQGGDVWSYAEMNKFLYKPKKYAKGTKMNFIGLKKPEDRANVIAWLRTLADSPAPLPTQAQIEAEKAQLLPPETPVTEENGAEKIEEKEKTPSH